MSQVLIGKLTAGMISVIFAVWDIRFRRIPLWTFALSFLSGCVYAAVVGRPVSEVLLSAVPGVLLMLISAVTKGGVGIGDGLFFGAMAGFLSPAENLLTLMISVFLAAFAALVFYAGKRNGKASIPFLSLVPPALLILFLGEAGW